MDRTDLVLDTLEKEWKSRQSRPYGLPLIASLCGLWFLIGVVTTKEFLSDSASDQPARVDVREVFVPVESNFSSGYEP